MLYTYNRFLSPPRLFSFRFVPVVRCVVFLVHRQSMSTSAGPEIDWETSLSKMQEFLASKEALDCPTGIVITGYIASTKEGVATTLKR